MLLQGLDKANHINREGLKFQPVLNYCIEWFVLKSIAENRQETAIVQRANLFNGHICGTFAGHDIRKLANLER